MIDKLLEKFNLKYDDLNPFEKETLNTMLQAVQKGQISIPKLRDYISQMKYAVENELTKVDFGSKQDTFLKARLRNYMLLEAFLISPEKAQEQLEAALANMMPKG